MKAYLQRCSGKIHGILYGRWRSGRLKPVWGGSSITCKRSLLEALLLERYHKRCIFPRMPRGGGDRS